MRRSDKQRFCGKETSRMLTRHIASVVAIQCGLQLINLWACEKLPESRLLKILSGLMLLMMAAEVFYFVFRILRSIRAVEGRGYGYCRPAFRTERHFGTHGGD